MARNPRNNFISIPDNNPFIRNPSAFGQDDGGLAGEAFAGITGVLVIIAASAVFGIKTARERARERDDRYYPSNKKFHHPLAFDPERDTSWDPHIQGRYQDNQLTVTWSGEKDLRMFNNNIVIKMKGGTMRVRDGLFGYSRRIKVGKNSYQVKMYRIDIPQQSDCLNSDVKYLLENEPYYQD